ASRPVNAIFAFRLSASFSSVNAPAWSQYTSPEWGLGVAGEAAPHFLTYYLHDDVAARLHTYYNAERFLVDDESMKHARLALVAAARQVLANGLAVLGVAAPERM
ncbi:MAG TPA: DALR anticodon-binding domain-containing protein, partial [Usitatibacter sp.]|nr:DALR anticodon-binding domain-containing protein [Usitatibacter sp.]